MAFFVNLRENIYFRLSMRKMMEKVGLDRKGFDTLFELYYGELTYFVYSFVNDKEVAKDLVHDLFLNLWQNRRQIDPSLSVKSYLFRIARNYAFNYLKHLKVIATNERDVIETYELAGQDTEELESRLERVRRLFEKLPEKQKEVVFKTHINREQVIDQYRICDVFVCSSKKEAYPVVAHEAGATGMPIISTDVGIYKKITGRYYFAFYAGKASFEIKKSFLEKSCFLLSPVFYGSLYCVKTIIDDRVYTRRL